MSFVHSSHERRESPRTRQQGRRTRRSTDGATALREEFPAQIFETRPSEDSARQNGDRRLEETAEQYPDHVTRVVPQEPEEPILRVDLASTNGHDVPGAQAGEEAEVGPHHHDSPRGLRDEEPLSGASEEPSEESAEESSEWVLNTANPRTGDDDDEPLGASSGPTGERTGERKRQSRMQIKGWSTLSECPLDQEDTVADEQGLDILVDAVFVAYLGMPDEWGAVSRVAQEFLEDDNARKIFAWQREQVARYRKPASAEVLALEFNDGKPWPTPQLTLPDVLDRLEERYGRNAWRRAQNAFVEDLKRSGRDDLGNMVAMRARVDTIQKTLRSQTTKRHTYQMSEIQSAPQEFLIKPYLPVGIFTLLQGPGGVGKSSVAAYWAAELSRTIEGNIMFIGDEDAPERTQERLAARKADMSKVLWRDIIEAPLTFPSCEAELQQIIETENVRWVIFDTATEVLDPRLNQNEAQDVTSVITSFRRVAAKTRSVIMGVGHTNRQSGDAYKVIGGSIAWYNRSKSALLLGPDPAVEQYVHLFHKKHNYSREGVPLQFEKCETMGEVVYLELLGESDLTYDEVFSPAPADTGPTKTEETNDFLRARESGKALVLDELWEEFHKEYPETSRGTFDRTRSVRKWETKRIGSMEYLSGTTQMFAKSGSSST